MIAVPNQRSVLLSSSRIIDPLTVAGFKFWMKSETLTLSTSGYALTGTWAQTGNTLTGIGTAALSEVVIGDVITGTGISGTVTAINSNTDITLSSSATVGAGVTCTTTPQAGVSDRVTTLTDNSGSGNNITQSTAIQKAIKKPNIQNGLSTVRFNGVNHNYSVSPIVSRANLNANGFMLFVVFKATAVSMIAGQRSTSHGRYSSGGLDTSGAYGYDGGYNNAPLTLNDSVFHIAYAGYDGSSLLKARKDNGNEVTAACGDFTLDPDEFGIGNGNSAIPGYLAGDIGELLYYSPIPTASQIIDLMNYLNYRWKVYTV